MLNVQQQAIETYLPGLTRSDGEEISPSSWLLEKTKQQIPGLNMNNNREETQEDKETSQKIVEENQEFLEAKLVEENQEAGPDSSGLEITGGTRMKKTVRKRHKRFDSPGACSGNRYFPGTVSEL